MEKRLNMKIKTERLTIRYIVEEDWPSIQAIWEDFNRTEYVIYDTVKNTDKDAVKEKVSKWVEVNRNSDAHIFLAVCLENKVIGFVSLNKRTEGYEIGYGFLGAYHGMGYAKESLTAILEYMQEKGVKKILAGTAIKNYPSVGLLNRLGFKLTSMERISFHKDYEGNDIYFDGGNFEKTFQ